MMNLWRRRLHKYDDELTVVDPKNDPVALLPADEAHFPPLSSDPAVRLSAAAARAAKFWGQLAADSIVTESKREPQADDTGRAAAEPASLEKTDAVAAEVATPAAAPLASAAYNWRRALQSYPWADLMGEEDDWAADVQMDGYQFEKSE
jgi:hypothetical protein